MAMAFPSLKTKEKGNHILLAQWLLVLYIIVFTRVLTIKPQIFLPFIPFLDNFKKFPFFGEIVLIIFVISIACVILDIYSDVFISILGIGIIFLILSDRTRFSNNLSYTAFMMILCGISHKVKDSGVFRIQIALLYLGAGVNKLLDPDWLNGYYFENFALNIFHIPFYEDLADILPKLLLSKLFSIFTIILELSFGILFLCNIRIIETILIGYLFHGMMLIATKGLLSILFFYLMGVSYLLSVNYPKEAIIVNYSESVQSLIRVFQRMDLDKSFLWKKQNQKKLNLIVSNKVYTDMSAWIRLFVYHKYLHFSGLLLFVILRIIVFIF